VARTGIAGSEADDIYGPDNATLRRVKRITDIVVDHGINFDGFNWAYDLYPQDGKPSSGSVGYEDGTTLGNWRGEKDKLFEHKLDPDEYVVEIEAACEEGGGIHRIAIRTNKGRYPSEGGFFGRDPSARQIKKDPSASRHRFPRLQGHAGPWDGALLPALGRRYALA